VYQEFVIAAMLSFDHVLCICTHAAPTLAPSNVKVTLIEEDTALVSWKPPDEPNVAVTHYTILYAARSAWIAGEWQVLQREGKERTRLHRYAGGRHGDVLLSHTNGPLEISNSFNAAPCDPWMVPWQVELTAFVLMMEEQLGGLMSLQQRLWFTFLLTFLPQRRFWTTSIYRNRPYLSRWCTLCKYQCGIGECIYSLFLVVFLSVCIWLGINIKYADECSF